MPESKDSLSRILSQTTPPKPPVEEAEQDALSIAEMDGRYSSMRPANKNLTRLHVILRDGKVRSYQFAYLDAESTFDGNSFVVTFAGVTSIS